MFVKRSQLSSLTLPTNGRLTLNGAGGNVAMYFDGVNANFVNANFILTGGTFLASGTQIGATSGGITTNLSNTLDLSSNCPDGAAGIAIKLRSGAAYSNATAKIASFQNNTTEKLAVDKAGKLIAPTGQADSVVGTATMVAGSVVVNTTSVTASSKIFLTRSTVGGTVGDLRCVTRVAGTSFTITSASGTDTSAVDWFLVN